MLGRRGTPLSPNLRRPPSVVLVQGRVSLGVQYPHPAPEKVQSQKREALCLPRVRGPQEGWGWFMPGQLSAQDCGYCPGGQAPAPTRPQQSVARGMSEAQAWPQFTLTAGKWSQLWGLWSLGSQLCPRVPEALHSDQPRVASLSPAAASTCHLGGDPGTAGTLAQVPGTGDRISQVPNSLGHGPRCAVMAGMSFSQ